MKFTKVIKADENYDPKVEELIFDAQNKFGQKLEEVISYYKLRGLSKENIFGALEFASIHLEDVFDEL